MSQILLAIVNYETIQAKARTKAVLQAKKRRGERTGQIPLGHDLGEDGKHLVPNEVERIAIETVMTLRKSGMTLQAITDTMNSKGVATKRGEGSRWHLTTVDRLLRRHAVAGDEKFL